MSVRTKPQCRRSWLLWLLNHLKSIFFFSLALFQFGNCMPHVRCAVLLSACALIASYILGREWTTKEIDPTNNETPYDGKGRPPNTDVIKPPNTDVLYIYSRSALTFSSHAHALLVRSSRTIFHFSSRSTERIYFKLAHADLSCPANVSTCTFVSSCAFVSFYTNVDWLGRVYVAFRSRSSARVASRPRQKRDL